ncbi:hypothetical protein BH09ACT7_BH09ACT7_14400 [soil metagenome]
MKTITSGGLSLLIALIATIPFAGPASATPQDDALYVKVLTDQGIIPKYYGPDEAVVNGQAICVAMDQHGMSQADMVDAVASTDHLAPNDAAFVVGVATAAYCPELEDG